MKKLALIIGVFTLGATYSFAQDTPTRTTTTTTTTTTEEPTTPPPPPAIVVETPSPAPAVVEEHDREVKHGYIGGRVLATFSYFRVQNASGDELTATTDATYGGGGLVGVNFGRNVGMQLEVLYSQYAQKFKDVNVNRTVRINYVNNPLLLMFNTNVAAPVNLNISGGPQLDINTGSKIESTKIAGTDEHQTTAVHTKKTTKIALAKGAGLDFNIANAITLNI